jgi:hypothetical protein|tara:strand:+ start:95 stop:457 length:363 start_codon:yes stop_codon:yes gene_type:complete
MNIIIDPEQLVEYQQKYTVLELDTFRVLPENKEVKAYCVVESIPILEMQLTEGKRNLHNGLLENYRKRNWNYCNDALDHLVGSWNKELDSFYDDVRNRINVFMENDPGEDFDGIIEKHTA